MRRFSAIFVKVDGLEETEIGESCGLNAATKEEAEIEAQEMGPPHGANFIKILDEGRVVSRLGFGL